MEDSALWQAVLGEIELSVSRGNFVTWFKKTELTKVKDGIVTIGVPNIFVKNQLEKKFDDLVVATLAKNGLKPERVEYKIQASAATVAYKDEPQVLKNPSGLPSAPTIKTPRLTNITHSYRQGLNQRYSFDNFVVGASNELAYAACQAIVAEPGTKYNPLFIYGGVGIGKTHLIQAVGNAILANRPGARVIYASTEQFVQEFVDALRFKKNTSDFASFYRGADVL